VSRTDVPASGRDAPLQAADSAVPTPTIADPAPLGLAGFAMTTFFLSIVNAGFVDKAVEPGVLGLAIFYGGGAQLLAGIWEFRRGNVFGALAFSSYGAFWLSFFFYVRYVAPDLGSNASTATGLFLLGWAIFTAYMSVAATRVSGIVLAVFVALTVTFLILSLGAFNSSDTTTKVGGYVGLITAVLAWYASFAGVTASTFGRSLLPTWPRA
jgi:succinate-acetate transporter protein